MPRNVLVLVFDTARADAFEPYGASPGSTPAVAQMAASGVATDMFATACWTLPSHASMFTGVLPRALGLGQAPGGTPEGAAPLVAAQRDRLLPEVLRRAGWDTRGVSTNPWVSPYAGFATGFEEFEFVRAGARQEQALREDLRGRLMWAYDGLRANTDDGAGEAERVILRWLGEPRDRPFFWFVNLVECHSPYLPPRPYNDLGAIDRVRAADEARRYLSMEAIWRACLTELSVPDEALDRMRHLYARSVRLMDDWLGRVLERLDEAGVLDDTLVVATSDHGENFGEGGLLAHAFSLDDRLIRVPFVANQPGFAANGRARSLADLPLMLAEHLELEDHPWGDWAARTSLPAAQFDFIGPGDPRVQLATDMWGLDDDAREILTTPLTCVTDGRLKLMRRGEQYELYDIDADPLEENPISPAEHADRDRVAALEAALAAPAVQEVATDTPAPAPSADADDLEHRMRLLGYI